MDRDFIGSMLSGAYDHVYECGRYLYEAECESRGDGPLNNAIRECEKLEQQLKCAIDKAKTIANR